MHDVCIVGAGPAGLSAALILGRCRRNVAVFDSGQPRNSASRGLHGFLTRDGTPPLQLREMGRAELKRYPTVRLHDGKIVSARRLRDRFALIAEDGHTLEARFLLLATGRVDLIPAKPGFRELYGSGVYHCPICDGWEHRDQSLAVCGGGDSAVDLALELLTWSRQVALFTDGDIQFDRARRQRLERNGIVIHEREVAGLTDEGTGSLRRVLLADGAAYACTAMFVDADCPQRSPLPEDLGCEVDATGAIKCDEHAATRVPGLFVAGNVRCGIHLAVTAAAEGAEAAIAINDALVEHLLA